MVSVNSDGQLELSPLASGDSRKELTIQTIVAESIIQTLGFSWACQVKDENDVAAWQDPWVSRSEWPGVCSQPEPPGPYCGGAGLRAPVMWAHRPLPLAPGAGPLQASDLPLAGLSFLICEMGIRVVPTSKGRIPGDNPCKALRNWHGMSAQCC